MICRPQALLFDFGDTLLREGPVGMLAGAMAVLELAHDKGRRSPERVAAAMGELMADLDPRRRSAQLEPPPETMWRLVYEPLNIRFRVPLTEVEWAFWSAATRWTVEPGLQEALAEVQALDIPWGVLSNTMFRGETVARQLELSGVAGFRWVMASSDYVLRKPHPRLFELAARRLGVGPNQVWFVGDSYENDVCGAAKVGMVPIWYRPGAGSGRQAPPAAHVIDTWSAFAMLLKNAQPVPSES